VSIILFALTFYFIKDTIDQKPIPQSKKPVFSLPDKYLLKFSLICFASMACENAMYDWSAIYFQKAVHAEKAAATAAFVVYMIAMTSGRLVGDKLVTRIGIKTVLRFSGIFIFCGLMLAVLLPFTITAMLGFVLVGLGVSCVVPMIFSLAGKSKNMSSSSALASISTVGYTGFLIVPPFVGYIAHASSIRWSFGIIAFFGVMMVWLVSKIKTEDSHAAGESALLPEN
jgi:fucose permease